MPDPMESTETKRLVRTSHSSGRRYEADTTAATTAAVDSNETDDQKSTPKMRDDDELQSRGISIVDTKAKNFSNVTPEEVSDYYKSLGEWQDILPKTDYTYSPVSQYYTKKINGKIPIIPNMSRKNIWKVRGELEHTETSRYLNRSYTKYEKRLEKFHWWKAAKSKTFRRVSTVVEVIRRVVRTVHVTTTRIYESTRDSNTSGGSFLYCSLVLGILALLAYLLMTRVPDAASSEVTTPFLKLYVGGKNLVFYMYDLTWSSGTFLTSMISVFLSNALQVTNTVVFAPLYKLVVLLSETKKVERPVSSDVADMDAAIRKWFDQNADNIAKKVVGNKDFVNFINERFRQQEAEGRDRFDEFLKSYNFEETRIGEKLASLEAKVAQWRSEDHDLLKERVQSVKEEIKTIESRLRNEIIIVLASIVGTNPSPEDLKSKFTRMFEDLQKAHSNIRKLSEDFNVYRENATENAPNGDRLKEELLMIMKSSVEDLVTRRVEEWRQSVVLEGTVTSDKINIAENYVMEAIKKALEIYDADKTGKPDFALESQGGIILSTRCTETKTANAQFSIFGIPLWHASRSPRTVIQPGVHPGECWAFPGSTGYLVIQLSERIRVTGFTMEHIPKSLASNGIIDSAPKDFSVWALLWESDPEPKFLGEFRFDEAGSSVQYFEAVRLKEPYQIVELKILSNHGKMDYTCLYRFRVHGVPA